MDAAGARGEERVCFELRDVNATPRNRGLDRREVSETWCGGEIGRIPPMLRQALVLREVEQLPMPDVADQTRGFRSPATEVASAAGEA